MEFIVLNCPTCQGRVQIDDLSKDIYHCSCCGNPLYLKRTEVNRPKMGNVKDEASGIVIASVDIPSDYEIKGKLDVISGCNEWPIATHITAYNKFGTVLSFVGKDSYTDASKCPMLSSSMSYVQGAQQVSRMKLRNYESADQFCDNFVLTMLNGMNATNKAITGTRPMNFDRAKELAKHKAHVEMNTPPNLLPNIVAYNADAMFKTYSYEVGGMKFGLAMTAKIYAAKFNVPTMGMGMGIGLLGGLFGMNQAPNSNQGGFAALNMNQAIDWVIEDIAFMIAPINRFEEDCEKGFKPFITTLTIDETLAKKEKDMIEQLKRDVDGYTRQNLMDQQRNFQMYQQIHREQQAAFDSYNRAWQARSDSHHASFMASSAAASHSSPDFSEAIRGVNTYVDSYGKEYEVSVDYDRAYTNASGDVLGSNSAFEPGNNWTEMNRR